MSSLDSLSFLTLTWYQSFYDQVIQSLLLTAPISSKNVEFQYIASGPLDYPHIKPKGGLMREGCDTVRHMI